MSTKIRSTGIMILFCKFKRWHVDCNSRAATLFYFGSIPGLVRGEEWSGLCCRRQYLKIASSWKILYMTAPVVYAACQRSRYWWFLLNNCKRFPTANKLIVYLNLAKIIKVQKLCRCERCACTQVSTAMIHLVLLHFRLPYKWFLNCCLGQDSIFCRCLGGVVVTWHW